MDRFGQLVTVLLLITVAGCATPVKVPDGDGIPESVDRGKALELEEAGEYAAAARQYLGLARQEQQTERRDALWVKAGELLLLADELDNAEQALNQATTPLTDLQLAFRQRLALGELAVKRTRPEDALQYLNAPTAETPLTQTLMMRLHRLRAEAFTLNGNALEAANDLLLLESLLGDEGAIAENQTRILQTLSPLSDQALEQMQVLAPETLAGWLALTRIAKAPLGAAQFQRQITEWRNRFGDHPALQQTIERLRTRPAVEPLRPHKIAILLPTSGPFAEPSAAVRDGLLAAYYSDAPSNRPELAFYSVRSDGTDVNEVMERSVQEGAELVVGPLSKTAVTSIARRDQLPVPVLALNQAELGDHITLPINLYQFGLPPEDEARQAAERAWIDGHTKALILAPGGLWGSRVATSFRTRWEELGGTVLEQQSYDPTKSDFSTPIKALLDLNESQARRKNLERLMGQKIKFEPRRRQDVEILFLAAFPRQARLLRPQLKFHRASQLPIIATSHVFTGSVDRAADRDMDDLLFCDTPWTLGVERPSMTQRNQIRTLWPKSQERLARLYAMGFDAYRVIPYLEWLQTYPSERYEGETGHLVIDDRGRIHRRLAWARFRKGAPDLIGFAPELQELEEERQTAPADSETEGLAIPTAHRPVL